MTNPDVESPKEFWDSVGYLILDQLTKVGTLLPDPHTAVFIPQRYKREDLSHFFGVPIRYVDIPTPYIGLRVC